MCRSVVVTVYDGVRCSTKVILLTRSPKLTSPTDWGCRPRLYVPGDLAAPARSFVGLVEASDTYPRTSISTFKRTQFSPET
jgi:hypothetical protein